MQKGLECGGAYLKLLTENPGEGIRAGDDFKDGTPFTIMFGPVSGREGSMCLDGQAKLDFAWLCRTSAVPPTRVGGGCGAAFGLEI